MGLKKKTKVSAEFSMSSLTDIIFLLLIFFMLTSSLVAPNALNLKLPGTSRSSKVADPSKIDNVRITKNGNYYLNGKTIGIIDLENALRSRSSKISGKMNLTIAPDKGTPTEHVVAVMDIAMRLNINGILATQKFE